MYEMRMKSNLIHYKCFVSAKCIANQFLGIKKISILFVIVTKNAILIKSAMSVHMFDRRFIVLSHGGRRFVPLARSN